LQSPGITWRKGARSAPVNHAMKRANHPRWAVAVMRASIVPCDLRTAIKACRLTGGPLPVG
jgi:hypothetical protein